MIDNKEEFPSATAIVQGQILSRLFNAHGLQEIRDEMELAPLSVRAHLADSIAEFVDGVMFASKIVTDFEVQEEFTNRYREGILGILAPELLGAPEKLIGTLQSEGHNFLTGMKIASPMRPGPLFEIDNARKQGDESEAAA